MGLTGRIHKSQLSRCALILEDVDSRITKAATAELTGKSALGTWIRIGRKLKMEGSNKPLHKAYFPLGQGKGIALTVWSNNIQVQRQERGTDGHWIITQEISLARNILEKLFIRLPKFFELMEKKDESPEAREV